MELFTRDFSYHLPEDRIALFPAEQRDQSKLLIYKNGAIQHDSFSNIVGHLPESSLLIFNNTEVIPARLKFIKESGAIIEIFLLKPEESDSNTQSSIRWHCTIGNKKRWKARSTLKLTKGDTELHAQLVNEEIPIVEFHWTGNKTWNEILRLFGDTPLPPYIKRETVKADIERYQTVYSAFPGAVAAPTAGLHFTPEILQKLPENGIYSDFITLHVSAGTFLPIKTEKATDHAMHEEKILVTKKNIDQLIAHGHKIIPVGTTSCRSLESLYWFGVKLLSAKGALKEFAIDQHYAYQQNGQQLPSRMQSLQAVNNFMEQQMINEIKGTTSIYIYPGYKFRMTDGLITNFHQPNSTLLLLIAALVGENWKKIYNEALSSGYRFLSYGDSSLLIP